MDEVMLLLAQRFDRGTPPMKFKNEPLWDEGVSNNTDPYGACVYRFAKQWANLMEKRIKKGETINQMHRETSHIVDGRRGMGITGYMYGCAVSILSSCWLYGEELRVAHNAYYKNEGPGVVNPAIITIGMGAPTDEDN
jgi:hypothetical protein